MSFTSPLAFLWLGIAIPVILLYFLKLRRRKVAVSSTWLWVRSIQDLRVNAPFQRLRKNLLLLLQVLLIILAALALTAPVGRASPPEHKRWVLLIDRSASMQMKDVAPSRLEKAKDAARQLLAGAGSRDEFMVIAFSSRAQVMTPFTANRAAAERAIDAIEPADTSTRAQEAFRIAAGAVQSAGRAEIVVLSDGRFEAVEGLPEGGDVRYVPLGAKPRNAAITAVDARRPARADEPWTVFAQVDLFHDQAQEVPVELFVNGELRAVKKVRVEAQASAAVIFEVSRPEPEIVHLKLAWEDDLEVDDRAWFVVRQDRLRLLLATEGNFFLERAVAHLKDAEAFRTADLASVSLGNYDVAILDGIVPDVLPEGKYLIFGGVPKWEGIEVGAEAEQPGVVDWDRRHPVTRMVSLGDLFIKSAPRVTLSGFGAPIVEGPTAPLVFAWEKGRTRAVVVTFGLLQSDWPLKLSFPLFVADAVEWLTAEGKAPTRPGDPLRIRLGQDEQEVEVTAPAGGKRTLRGEPGREAVFGETDRCGLYGVSRKSGSYPVPLNLLDPQESSGGVVPELRLGTGRVKAAAAFDPGAEPLWRWFALAALVLLLGEWYVYHRRIDF